MLDRTSFRLSAALLAVGEILFIAFGILHPAHEDPNQHRAVFTEYAHSHNWTSVHIGQFAAMAFIVAGLLVLLIAVDVRSGTFGWIARLAGVSAVVTLALYGVLQAIDGVALKHAVDAWISAPHAQQVSAFENAETVRWLEWGARSYQQFMQGLTLLLVGVLVVGTARIPKAIGYLIALSGGAYVIQGFVIGSEGFSATADRPGFFALILQFVWVAWLAVHAWRTKHVSDGLDRDFVPRVSLLEGAPIAE